jgi:hypothetical protein
VCDTLVALAPATRDGVTLFAKTSDRPPDEQQVVVWSPPRLDHRAVRATHIDVAAHDDWTVPALISRPTWCWGAEHGVNVAGVAIGNEAIYTTLDPRPFPPALTGMDLVRLGLERATTAQDAVGVITDLLERYGQGGTGHADRFRPYWSSFLVADPTDAWVVETSGREWAAEQVGDVRAISNRTTIRAFDAVHRHPRQPVEVTVDPRLRRSERVLAQRPVTRAALEAHLRNHADGAWSTCMHVVEPGHEEATTAWVVAELPSGATPVSWFGLGSPCRATATRHEVEWTAERRCADEGGEAPCFAPLLDASEVPVRDGDRA